MNNVIINLGFHSNPKFRTFISLALIATFGFLATGCAPNANITTSTSASPFESALVTSDSPIVFITPTPQKAAPLAAATKTTGCHESGGLPDTGCTPGAVDTRVTQANITSTICVSGYTAKVRPSTSYTNSLKVKQIAAYGYSDTSLSSYEEDHLVSLELGGSPDSAANLWPEPYGTTYGAKEKDKVENYLHSQICGGSLSLADAQSQIATNWIAVYTSHYGTLSSDTGIDYDDTAVTATPTPTSVPTAAQTPKPTAVQSYDASSPPVKMSTSKICHLKGDPYYARTLTFTSYDTMDACVAAGGRPSK